MIVLDDVLVPVDFSQPSCAAVAEAVAIADKFDATVHLLNVVTEPLDEMWSCYAPAGDFLARVRQLQSEGCRRLQNLVAGRSGRRLVVSTVWGDPVTEILKYAAGHAVDMIVCGTHGRHGWNRLAMGSVAENLVRRAPCPVLTVQSGASQAPELSAA